MIRGVCRYAKFGDDILFRFVAMGRKVEGEGRFAPLPLSGRELSKIHIPTLSHQIPLFVLSSSPSPEALYHPGLVDVVPVSGRPRVAPEIG